MQQKQTNETAKSDMAHGWIYDWKWSMNVVRRSCQLFHQSTYKELELEGKAFQLFTTKILIALHWPVFSSFFCDL